MSTRQTAPPPEQPGRLHPARLLVLGANGPTGRQVVRQALARGHRVQALTRHPETFPVRHDRLDVVAGDATAAGVLDAAVEASDAVVCTIGTAFTRRPVRVYSATADLLVQAMLRHRRRRLVTVTSAGLTPSHPPGGSTGSAPAGSGVGALVRTARHALDHDRVRDAFRAVMRHHVGRTVYDDMAAMEAVVRAGDLDWTIVRPPGLTDAPGRGYVAEETEVEGALCAREDLAAMLLDQLEDDRFVRKVAAVATPGLRVGALHMLWHEVLKR
ncbi:SDR family oxidoreductase [Kineococcus gypseus]|uniref:NAD(P)-dependent oxidoreductase n=1 Tax=Kineococcus gypseus TaxID=1637102 RepID=UPI003D7C5923